MDPMTEYASIPLEVNGLKILKMLMNTNANKATNKMVLKNDKSFLVTAPIKPMTANIPNVEPKAIKTTCAPAVEI